MRALFTSLVRDESGVTAIEYGLIAALIAIAAITMMISVGTNLTATFLLARAAERRLRAAKGAIVTIASTRALMSEPNTESYSASKGGLLALTHALAISLGPDVRVNCVSPGWKRIRAPAQWVDLPNPA